MEQLADIVKTLGVVASLLWAVERIFNDIRFWRGGSPELRLIRDQLKTSNDRIYSLLERIIDRLEER